VAASPATAGAAGALSARDLAPFWKRMRPGAWRSVVLGSFEKDVARREARVVRTICNRRDLWDETAAAWAEIQRARPVSRETAHADRRGSALARAGAARGAGAVPSAPPIVSSIPTARAPSPGATARRSPSTPRRAHLTTDAGDG
jgi:hypothetical protein